MLRVGCAASPLLHELSPQQPPMAALLSVGVSVDVSASASVGAGASASASVREHACVHACCCASLQTK
jgi:hypothetical protein